MLNKLTGKSQNAIMAEARHLKTAEDMANYLCHRRLIANVGSKEIAKYCKPDEWHHSANKTRVFFRRYYSLFEVYKHRTEIREDIKDRKDAGGAFGILREGQLKVTAEGRSREFRGKVVKDSDSDKVTVFDTKRKQKYRYNAVEVHILIINEETNKWERLL